MREDYRANRRFHIFKSVTGKYVLIDRSISNDWQLYTPSISEFVLKLIAFGVFEDEAWFETDDFSKKEKKRIIEAMSLIEHQFEKKEKDVQDNEIREQ